MATASLLGPGVDPAYRGKTKLAALLFKSKRNATFSLLFGRHVKRYFVLDLAIGSFVYYADETKHKLGAKYLVSVLELAIKPF